MIVERRSPSITTGTEDNERYMDTEGLHVEVESIEGQK